MHACRIAANGQLEWVSVSTPEPGAGEVRVRVRAAGLNRADVLQCKGAYPAPPGWPSDIPGLEYAGEVEALGPSVFGIEVGQRVYGLVGGGAFAEQLVVHHRALSKAPTGLSWAELAALPEAYLTAYDAMVTQGGLRTGDTVLIHAVGSGVGTAAVQIARALGAHSVGTARSADKLERAKELGLEFGVYVQDARFSDALHAANWYPRVVLDLVGGSYVPESLKALAHGGCLMLVGLTGGRDASFDLGMILSKRLRVQGTVMRARPLEERIAVHQLLERQLGTWFQSGACKPVLSETFSMSQANEALARLATNQTYGKLVLVAP